MAAVELFSGGFRNSGIETTVAALEVGPGSMWQLAEVAAWFDSPDRLRFQIRWNCIVVWFSHPDKAQAFVEAMNSCEIDTLFNGKKIFVTFESKLNRFRDVRIQREEQNKKSPSATLIKIKSQAAPLPYPNHGFPPDGQHWPMVGHVRKFQENSLFMGDDDFDFVLVQRGAKEIREILQICTEHGGKIVGGFVRWMCSPNTNPTPADDIDVFLPSLIDLMQVGKKLEKLGYLHKSTRENMSVLYVPKPLPSAAFSSGIYGASCPPKSDLPPYPVQLVIPREVGYLRTISDNELINFLDFTVTRLVLVDENVALADADFLTDEKKRRLVIRNIVCPIAGVRRLMKYTEKGYRASTLQIVKLFAEFMDRALIKDKPWASQLLRIGASALVGEVPHSEMASFFSTMYTD